MARKYRKAGQKASGGCSEILDQTDVLAGHVQVDLPVSVAEIITGVSDDIEQLSGQAGLLIMQAVMAAEVEALAGPKGRHDPDRQATRWAQQGGYVVLAGKKVPVTKQRLRDLEGHEVRLESYQRFQSPPRRQRSIYKQLINGISTRKYDQAIEEFTDGYGISKSALSRELVQVTRGSLQALCERRIDEIGRLAVLMIDGKEIDGEYVIVALGVDSKAQKHILGVVQGSTENSAAVQHLLDDLIERGLDASQRMLIVLDGSKALRKAVRKIFGERCPVQRCHLHKRRNVTGLLPTEYQRSTDQRIRTAYAMKDYKEAKAQLLKTVQWLEDINPSAAASLREGLEDTLTLHRLQLPPQLRESLQSTNLIESAFSVADDVIKRVKRWRGGDMRLRWAAAGLLMAEKQFRRIRGCRLMPRLMEVLDGKDAGLDQVDQAA